MELNIITKNGIKQIDFSTQEIEVKIPIVVLEVVLNEGENCKVIQNGEVSECKVGVNRFDVIFTLKNKAFVKLRTLKSDVILEIYSTSCFPLGEKNVKNIIDFYKSVEALKVNGSIKIKDFISAVDNNAISLLSKNSPLTFYDDEDRLNLITNVLQKQVRSICSNPKQGIKTEELVQDINLVKRINSNTFIHLSSHTENWKARNIHGLMVKRLLADVLEDNMDIYENLFFKLAIDDITRYVRLQINNIEKAKYQREVAKDWSDSGNVIQDYSREPLIRKLFSGNDTDDLCLEILDYEEWIDKWKCIYETLVSIRKSTFYNSINSKERISGEVRITNILKNDQRYNALYRVWLLIRKNINQNLFGYMGFANDLPIRLGHYYEDYIAMVAMYSMDYLKISFDENAEFKLGENGELSISAYAQDELIKYHLYTIKDEFKNVNLMLELEEKISVPVLLPDEYKFNESQFIGKEESVTYSRDENTIYLHGKLDSEIIGFLRNLYHVKSSELKKWSRKEAQDYKWHNAKWSEFIDNLLAKNKTHESHKKILKISPLLLNIRADAISIKDVVNDIFSGDDEFQCFVFPIVYERYHKLKEKHIFRYLLNYGEAFYQEDTAQWKNYHRAIIPGSQTDIRTILRLIKFISIHRSKFVMELEDGNNEADTHCPLCFSDRVTRLDEHTWVCNNNSCGIRWGKTRCQYGCGEYFYWVQPNVEINEGSGVLLRGEPSLSREYRIITAKEKIFDKYIISDFEMDFSSSDNSLYPVCPKCGTRRFLDDDLD